MTIFTIIILAINVTWQLLHLLYLLNIFTQHFKDLYLWCSTLSMCLCRSGVCVLELWVSMDSGSIEHPRSCRRHLQVTVSMLEAKLQSSARTVQAVPTGSFLHLLSLVFINFSFYRSFTSLTRPTPSILFETIVNKIVSLISNSVCWSLKHRKNTNLSMLIF